MVGAADPGLRIVAKIPDDPQPLGIGFNKNETNPLLVATVNGALLEIKQGGSYARLARKWGVP